MTHPHQHSQYNMPSEAIAAEFKEYAYSVSHDLSGPIRAMVEFSKLLTDKHAPALDEEGKEFLSLIIQSGEKLQDMMNGLLEYSRLNTMAKPARPLDCNQIAQDCMTVLQNKYPNIDRMIHSNTLPTVVADVDQIMQLFMVLFNNALTFQPSGQVPSVSLSADKEGDMYKFEMKDNGIGIEPKYHARIFQIFKRLHTDEEYPGVGMGLTLAHKIVQRYGGRIWVHSEGGHGTSIFFTLPAG